MEEHLDILIYSKDKKQGVLLSDFMKLAGYAPLLFSEAEDLYEQFQTKKFTFCIIDMHSMEENEFALATRIKSLDNETSLIFLCSQPKKDEIAALYALGADDVVRKPVDMEILQARIRAIYKRVHPETEKKSKVFLFGKFRFNTHKQTLSIGEKSIKLTTKEGELLKLLCENANQLIERGHALQIIWKNDNYFNARSMDVYITKLRRLLKDDPTIRIMNIHGKGYKLTICL